MQVMAALARSGQEAAALEQYASYSRMLSREFGILPSSEATALWEQIRSKHAGRGQAAAFPPEAETATAVSRMASAGAPAVSRDERRQVTALVCRRPAASGAAGPDGIDPEELHEQMARCNEQCSPILERLGGLRQPRQGADCLTYFGYPNAQEDAARRAVSAGLAIVEATRGSDPLRIGVHTGVMVTTAGGIVGNVPDQARD